MKYLHFILVVLHVMMLIGCKKEEKELDCCIGSVYNLRLSFRDSEGNDLFDLNNEDHLDGIEFDIYHFDSKGDRISSYLSYRYSDENYPIEDEKDGDVGFVFKGEQVGTIDYYFRIRTSDIDTIKINWDERQQNGDFPFLYNKIKFQSIFNEQVEITKDLN